MDKMNSPTTGIRDFIFMTGSVKDKPSIATDIGIKIEPITQSIVS